MESRWPAHRGRASVNRRVDISPSSYARWRASALGAITERLEHDLILSMLPPINGKRVLDVGCGDGILTEKLASRGADAIGVDANPDMIAATKQHAGGTYQVADAAALPFADNTFNAITAVTVLCVCANPEKLMQEMVRVLKPGGHLVIGELGRWSLWALVRRLRGLVGNRIWRETHFFTIAELTALTAGAGLKVQVSRGAVYYPPLGVAAQMISPMDATLSRACGQVGAAFIALSAKKI
jgi:SAM-dependent methyltransferase